MTDANSRIPAELNASLASETQRELAFALIEAQTRRHFLRSATGGLGAMFLGTLAAPLALSAEKAAAEGPARIDIRHDPKSPLGVLPPQFEIGSESSREGGA